MYTDLSLYQNGLKTTYMGTIYLYDLFVGVPLLN